MNAWFVGAEEGSVGLGGTGSDEGLFCFVGVDDAGFFAVGFAYLILGGGGFDAEEV